MKMQFRRVLSGLKIRFVRRCLFLGVEEVQCSKIFSLEISQVTSQEIFYEPFNIQNLESSMYTVII